MTKALVVMLLLYAAGMFVALGYAVGFGKGYSRALNDVMMYMDLTEQEAETTC